MYWILDWLPRFPTTRSPVLMPILGGTVPMSRIEKVLKLPIYGVPVVNPDNNQHSPDENLRLGNLWEAIVIYASLLRLPSPQGGAEIAGS